MEDLRLVYFSPSGTTRTVATVLTEGMGVKPKVYDLLRHPIKEPISFGKDTLAVFVFPVYAGRMPALCLEMLKRINGTDTPAVAVVVYGNRAYDDALLELRNTLTDKGFHVFAAAAFVAQHSIFPNTAKGRPDEADKERIKAFGQQCIAKLERGAAEVTVKGNMPYIVMGGVPIHPSGDRRCNSCGICVSICPMKAIPADNPKKTDAKRCIACTACIAACPQHSRGFHIPIIYPLAARQFAKKNAERKEPEIFI